MIVEKTIQFILDKYALQYRNTTIEKIICGATFTAVQLSNGYCGLAKTECNEPAMHGHRRKESLYLPGNIKGNKVLDFLKYHSNENYLDIIKLATINALSAEIMAKANYHIIENKDPLELVDITNKRIAMVGAFCSYIRKLSQMPCTLKVLELNANAFEKEYIHLYIPAERFNEIFSNADIVIITGSTLANHTMEQLLSEVPKNATVIVVGPTSGILPEFLFEQQVSIIGATQVIDADKLFSVIAEGGAAYHLFDGGAARKICILHE